MKRKWIALAATLSVVPVLALVAGLSIAADEEDSPTHKIMEKVNAKNGAINKAVRTPVAFKKAGAKAVVADSEELVKLFKEAREIKTPAEKQKKPYAEYTKLMDEMVEQTQSFAEVAAKGSQPDAKKSFEAVKKACTNCHNVFRVEEEEFK